MNNKTLLAAMIAATVAAPAVHAMSDREMEERFQKYEAQIKALQAEVSQLKSNGGVVYVEDLDKQTQRNTRQIDQIKSKLDAEDEKLKVNGFMTAAVSHGDDPIDAGYDIDTNPNFRGDSKAGVQFNYKLGDKSAAVVQLVARGRSNEPWETNAEWAYLSHGLSDSLQARMGRLRIPMYLASETLDVGYSYPWVRPPIELYQTSLTSYEGADMLYSFSTGGVNHTLQPFLGSSTNHDDVDQPYGYAGVDLTGDGLSDYNADLQLDFKDLYGVTLNSTFGNFTTKLTAMHLGLDGSVNAVDNLLPVMTGGALNVLAGGQIAEISDQVDYYAAGAMYDDGTWLAMLETAAIRVQDGALFGDSFAGHATGGYHIERWMPYATYAWAQSENDGDFSLPNRNMKSVSLGLRRELTDNLSAKMEWNNYFDLENNGNYAPGADSLRGSLGDDANVYTLSLDAVF